MAGRMQDSELYAVTCEHGPNDTAGCEGEVHWHGGVAYSKHYAPSHWSRLNKGAKPKNDFAADTTDEEQASLKAAIAAAKNK